MRRVPAGERTDKKAEKEAQKRKDHRSHDLRPSRTPVSSSVQDARATTLSVLTFLGTTHNKTNIRPGNFLESVGV